MFDPFVWGNWMYWGKKYVEITDAANYKSDYWTEGKAPLEGEKIEKNCDEPAYCTRKSSVISYVVLIPIQVFFIKFSSVLLFFILEIIFEIWEYTFCDSFWRIP